MRMLARRRALMETGGRLPGAYQEVEYLESTGGQYIDTGIFLPYQADFNIKYKNKASNTVGNVGFGYYNYNGFTFEEQPWLSPQANILIFGVDLADGYSFPPGFFAALRNIKLIGDKLYVDGELYSTYKRVGEKTASSTLLLGAYRRSSGEVGTNEGVLMGKMQFSYNGTLFDGVPCYRKSDNKPGMYDLVTKTFFTNAGTGEFIVGPDVS